MRVVGNNRAQRIFNESTGTLGHYNKMSFFAQVEIDIKQDTVNEVINFKCDGEGFRGQGYIEVVPASGYDDWKQGAVIGIKYALNKCFMKKYSIDILSISGLITDTNPTIIATAAAYAVWNALDIKLSNDEIKKN